jgi:hypothetical protein
MRSGLSCLKSCLTWLGIIFLFGGCFFSNTKNQFGSDHSPMYFAAAIPMLIVALLLTLFLPKPKKSTYTSKINQQRGQGSFSGSDDGYSNSDNYSDTSEAKRLKYLDQEERRDEKERTERDGRESEQAYSDRQQEKMDKLQAESDAQWEIDNQRWERQEQERLEEQQRYDEEQEQYWENKRNEKYYEDE